MYIIIFILEDQFLLFQVELDPSVVFCFAYNRKYDSSNDTFRKLHLIAQLRIGNFYSIRKNFK